MSQNLVEGGARRGLFQTRHGRQVLLTDSFEFSEPPQPGRKPETRTCWHGTLLGADGHSVDNRGVWEQSGAKQNSLGVLQREDLVILVRDDTPPVQQQQIEDAEAEPEPQAAA